MAVINTGRYETDRSGAFKLDLGGSYETGLNENNQMQGHWVRPNVIAVMANPVAMTARRGRRTAEGTAKASHSQADDRRAPLLGLDQPLQCPHEVTATACGRDGLGPGRLQGILQTT